jgi:hypothetical protein
MGQSRAALGAELVGVGDLPLALWAGRMQVVLAIGAEIVACGNGRGALWTSKGQGLADQQVDDEANDAVPRRKNEDEKRPKCRVHTAALRVFIHVAEHEEQTGNEKSGAGNHAG